jgi:capsid portal protein
MSETTIEEKKKRDDLKTERNQLFERYLKHPMDTRLALEIKLLDDQLAEAAVPATGRGSGSFHRRLKQS